MRSREIILERFKNLFEPSEKQKYLEQVWQILEKSYQDIGGLRVGGINEPNDLLKIPMWKLVVKDGVVHGVVLYKDKSGRKTVAAGTDGTEYGKNKLTEIVIQDVLRGRAYSEKSKAALGLALKIIPRDRWDAVLRTPEEAARILQKDLTPIRDIPSDEWPADAQITLQKYPEMKKYGYVRDLAGAPAFKVLMGQPGNRIT